MKDLLLIKYGELTTKKDNRNFFIKTLEENIKNKLKNYDIKIIRNQSRMYIEVHNNDTDIVISKLEKIFGIHRIVKSHHVNNNIEDIKDKTLEILKIIPFKTFKVETKRSLKTFPLKSMEINNILGGTILKNIANVKVDVHNPEITIYLEVRQEGTFIYTNKEEIKGLGGYPVGIQGRSLLMLSGGIDSPVAGFLALKRGINIDCVYFDSPPHTSVQALNKVITLTKKLSEYSNNIRLLVIPFTKMQEKIYEKVPDTYIVTIMRRMMYRIMEELLKRRKCLAIINGESIGQVASQTLTSINVINNVTNKPVIRPVACLDKIEIIDIAKKIDTYETSILPYEDCCTIFVPKHPVINPSLEKCILYEEDIPYQELILECLNNMKVIKDFKEEIYEELL